MAYYEKPITSVLVKPAGPDCNMACTYCFYLEKAALFKEQKTCRMTQDILEEMIRQVMQQCGPEVSFGWQGGEPTLMGLEFFKKAVQYQMQFGKGQNVGNGLQTNGLLIDEEWARFLKDYCFLVGLSIDGPEHVHNRYRYLSGGKGSWSRVAEKAKLLLDLGVDVNGLSVVTDYSVQFPEEIYQYLKSLGLYHMQFIPCVEPDPVQQGRVASFSVSPESFGHFLISIFDLWMNDFADGLPTTSIRYFESLFYTYLDMRPPLCTLLQECGNYVVIENNGDVYACDFFVVPDWKLGNVMENRIIDMLNSVKQYSFGQKKGDRPASCQTCRWLAHCWGGCLKDRLNGMRDDGVSHFCRSYQMFFGHADKQLREMADKWKRKHGIDEDVNIMSPENRRKTIKRNDPCPCGSGKKYKFCCGK